MYIHTLRGIVCMCVCTFRCHLTYHKNNTHSSLVSIYSERCAYFMLSAAEHCLPYWAVSLLWWLPTCRDCEGATCHADGVWCRMQQQPASDKGGKEEALARPQYLLSHCTNIYTVSKQTGMECEPWR